MRWGLAAAMVAATAMGLVITDGRSQAQTFGQPGTKTECYGEGQARVCVTTTTDANGNITIRSSGAGGTYEVRSESRVRPDGTLEAKSSDSMGNSYKVESSCDATGCTTRDSQGNVCKITTDGRMIGC